MASIQKRTSPIKFAHLAEKSENGSISNLSTKVYDGVVKRPPVEKTGYGFIESQEVQDKHGRDAFLHVKQCPWVVGMNLQPQQEIQFQYMINDRGVPEVTRIVVS